MISFGFEKRFFVVVERFVSSTHTIMVHVLENLDQNNLLPTATHENEARPLTKQIEVFLYLFELCFRRVILPESRPNERFRITKFQSIELSSPSGCELHIFAGKNSSRSEYNERLAHNELWLIVTFALSNGDVNVHNDVLMDSLFLFAFHCVVYVKLLFLLLEVNSE